MIPQLYAELGLVILFLLMIASQLYLLEKQGYLKTWLKSPKKYPITVKHQKDVDKIKQLIDKINVNEKELIGQYLLGGPVKILKRRTNDKVTIEGIYYDEDADISITYSKGKEEKYFG